MNQRNPESTNVSVQAADLVDAEVHEAHLDDSLGEICARMRRFGLTALPVANDAGYLVGVVRARDCQQMLANPPLHTTNTTPCARDALTRVRQVVNPRTSGKLVVELLANRTGGMVSLVEDGRCVGVVTHRSCTHSAQEPEYPSSSEGVSNPL